jgi:quercetin dioxygenase-like cupin family protein
MRNTMLTASIIAVAAVVLTARLAGEPVVDRDDRPAADRHGSHIIVPADQISWKDGPEALPRGAQFVVLEGDPASEGMFTMRLKAPAGYRIPPHTHPRVERVTVLKGSFKLGMGREFDEEKMQELKQGAFFTMPPGMEHFAMAGDEETIVQLNAHGPWEIHYINPDDDPRN